MGVPALVLDGIAPSDCVVTVTETTAFASRYETIACASICAAAAISVAIFWKVGSNDGC